MTTSLGGAGAGFKGCEDSCDTVFRSGNVKKREKVTNSFNWLQ